MCEKRGFMQIVCNIYIGHIVEFSNLTAMPGRDVLTAQAHLLFNYSSSAGEVAYLPVEAHGVHSAS